MFCSKCGAQMQDGAKFCAQCGFGEGTSETPQQKRKNSSWKTKRQLRLGWRWKVFFFSTLISAFFGLTTLLGKYRGATTQPDAGMVFGFIAGISFLVLLPTILRFLFRGAKLFFVGVILRKPERLQAAKEAFFAKFRGSRARLASNVVLTVLLAAIPAANVLVYFRLTEQERPLEHAIFYQGDYSEPDFISVADFGSGDEISVYAFPGQIHLAVEPTTSLRLVRATVQERGGTIVAQLPIYGIYLVAVEPGEEKSFIESLHSEPFVLNASPNAASNLSADFLDTSVVDLSDKGKNVYDLVPALLSSPDPTAKVISVQLDDFLTSAHGNTVDAARAAITGNTPSMRVQVGRAECGRLLAALQGPGGKCGSGYDSLNGLAAAIAGAQINGQKVDVNMSWGISGKYYDEDAYKKAIQPNSSLYQTLVKYEEQVFDVLSASKWAQEGNVLLNKAAGNGAILFDAQGRVLKEQGLDMTPAMEAWQNHPRYSEVLANNVVYYGAIDANGNLEPYSNFGKGLVYAAVPPRGGTSLAAPQGQGWSLKNWGEFPAVKSKDLAQAIRETATPNKRKLRVINPPALREMTSRTAASYRYQPPIEPIVGPPPPAEPPPGPQPPPGGGSWDGTYQLQASGGGCNVPGFALPSIPIPTGATNFTVRNNRIVELSISINAAGQSYWSLDTGAAPVEIRYAFSRSETGGVFVDANVSASISGPTGVLDCSFSFAGQRL